MSRPLTFRSGPHCAQHGSAADISEKHSAIVVAQAVIRRSRQEFRLVKQNLLSSIMFQRERRDAGIQTTTFGFEQCCSFTELDITQAVDLVMAEPDNLMEEAAAAAAESLLTTPRAVAEATPSVQYPFHRSHR